MYAMSYKVSYINYELYHFLYDSLIAHGLSELSRLAVNDKANDSLYVN